MAAGISLSLALIAVTGATLSICFALAQSHHNVQAATPTNMARTSPPGQAPKEVRRWAQSAINHPNYAAPKGAMLALFGVNEGWTGVVVVVPAAKNVWYVTTAHGAADVEWQTWLERRSH